MFSDYLCQALLQHALGGPAWTPPTTVYVGLSTSAPTQSSANNWNFTEPSTAGAYGRVALANTSASFVPVASEPTAGYQITNAGLIAFTQSTAPWLSGTKLAYFGMFDAPTGGNLLAFGPLNPAVQVEGPGYVIELEANQLIASIT